MSVQADTCESNKTHAFRHNVNACMPQDRPTNKIAVLHQLTLLQHHTSHHTRIHLRYSQTFICTLRSKPHARGVGHHWWHQLDKENKTKEGSTSQTHRQGPTDNATSTCKPKPSTMSLPEPKHILLLHSTRVVMCVFQALFSSDHRGFQGSLGTLNLKL